MRKQSKVSKKIGKRDVKVDTKAAVTLRTLGNEEAFYFYENIGKPTGESARSLRDLLERTKSVKLESLFFHHKRSDFKNWIENTLEDSKLAKRLEKIPVAYDEKLRAKIRSAILNRLNELEKTSDLVTICVDEPAIIAL